MKKLFKKVKGSEYAMNSIRLISGSSAAQLISIITAPILYRIYSKLDYGTLGVYMAIVGVLGVFSTLQYIQPILIEKDDEQAVHLVWLNRIINIVITLIVLFVILFFKNKISHFMGNEKLSNWLILAPISIFFSGQGQIYSMWATRRKKFKLLANNAVITAIIVPVISISIGIYNNGPFGLFLGLIISQILPSVILFFYVSKYDDFSVKTLNLQEVKKKMIQYRKFPIYSLPSEFINRLTNQLPVFLLSIFYNPAIVAVYNLSVRMLGLPIQLIGNSISLVFQQKASEEHNLRGEFSQIFKKTFKILMYISLVGLVFILIFGPNLFEFVFGSQWREAGEISKVMVFFFMIKLIVSPLSFAVIIKQKLGFGLLKDILTSILIATSLIIGFQLELGYLNSLIIFTTVYVFLDIVYLKFLYQFSK